MSDYFMDKGKAIGELVSKKNLAYGDSFAKSSDILEVLYPRGVTPEQYPSMLGVVRIIDKLFRVANMPRAFSENPGDDIAGYGILLSRILECTSARPEDNPKVEIPAVKLPDTYSVPKRGATFIEGTYKPWEGVNNG